MKNVMAEIKELEKKLSSHELWQMTKKEYEEKYGKSDKRTTVTTTGTGKHSPHKEAIMTALNRGLKVPENVLKDYPELKGY